MANLPSKNSSVTVDMGYGMKAEGIFLGKVGKDNGEFLVNITDPMFPGVYAFNAYNEDTKEFMKV